MPRGLLDLLLCSERSKFYKYLIESTTYFQIFLFREDSKRKSILYKSMLLPVTFEKFYKWKAACCMIILFLTLSSTEPPKGKGGNFIFVTQKSYELPTFP